MYIRTKDGVYEVSSKQKNTYYVLNGRWQFEKQDIINQSENLEELCDEFVVVNNTCFNTPQLLGTVIDKDYYKHEEVYGAVWCEFGLKCVAKLNSKGELELI